MAYCDKCGQDDAQLREAQEQLKHDWEGMKHQSAAFRVVLKEKDNLEAERDAAIERGSRAIRHLRTRATLSHISAHESHLRAEAAERDAKAKGALAEGLREYGHTLAEATRAALECVNPDDEDGLRAFALTIAAAVIDVPAEVLRARSPQSGQKEN